MNHTAPSRHHQVEGQEGRMMWSAIIIGVAIFSIIGVAIITRNVISFYKMPICSERDPDPKGYSYIKNISAVSMNELSFDELCTNIEKADDNGKTQCSVEWIDKEADIAWIYVSGVRDCHSSATNYVFAEWDYAKIIVRGHAISDSKFREAIEHP